ncbi:Phosphoribosyl-ATP diphosphatase [Elusimicrobium minutum Pei191]|uniref:Histidine biosynthesis bifunctional protein HisIE n=1 Tax=Elusimicrobium minutum (strain Pei191) TaxID=445932 RepID=B2KCM7_ELUMP|nr:bifunctional phosphoribosyl-AMP cyclohydrolase/phosphoribosyl-ATP diphosphatase HisIE [Elusimicrobium minutum]ACC98273.1 Phosphoribosyl-ATP diphosphatase [Elusimicrobium minutum Pei191]
MTDVNKVDFNKSGGLVPVIVQDNKTMRVLMLGYMNKEALEQTLKTKKITFFSRSKNRLWIKGETSGNFLTLESISQDCDNDALLARATPLGPVCHTGETSCFGDGSANSLAWLSKLEDVIEKRKKADPKESYTAKLFERGIERIAQKVGEEGLETALAAVAPAKAAELPGEAADLIFHLLVLLNAKGLNLADICQVLEQRHK